MKILCLHGFRTSGSFLQKQISKWDPSIFSEFDLLVFPDGIFPAGGKSDIDDVFSPPYFEWFQFNKDFTEYENLDKCVSFLCEYITDKGPFDGLLGFSQGKILKEHPPMKLFVSISGSKFRDPSICDVAYKDPIKVRSVHFIGARDWFRLPSEELATAFDNPLVIRHPQGHTIPRLDEAAVKQLSEWSLSILHTSVVNSTNVNNGKLPWMRSKPMKPAKEVRQPWSRKKQTLRSLGNIMEYVKLTGAQMHDNGNVMLVFASIRGVKSHITTDGL